MQTIYDMIQESPAFYAWAFGLVNLAWGLFIYFNKQRHDRELRHLEQDLRFNADRRLKLFDLKATQYSQYVTDLDSLGKKNQVEIPSRMQPIFDKYFQDYLAASEAADEEQQRKAIGWLGSQVSEIMQESLQDVMKLKYESNRLKLIATDQMLTTFENIENLNQEIFDITSNYMSQFTEIVIHQKTEETELFQKEATRLGEELQTQSRKLLSQMRQEINEI
ncbi:MAG: hypothetical protein RH947_00980 [Alcanivorax sp.]